MVAYTAKLELVTNENVRNFCESWTISEYFWISFLLLLLLYLFIRLYSSEAEGL